MEQNGIWIGITLLLLAAGCGFLLARKAALSVKQFRDDEHERFARKKAK